MFDTATTSPAATTTTTVTAAETDRFAALRPQLAGEVLTVGDHEYDDARHTISLRVNRFPAAIVRAANAHDVAAAITFARTHDLPISVRSGGHSIPRLSVIDDALVIDLSRMKRIDIDAATGIARIEPGVTSGDLAGPAHELGYALTTGDTQSVGMGGLTTGGGIGYLVRKYGLTIDSLLSAQVVTADGEVLTVGPGAHEDLFWALRGGGGNMGVVTEFTYRLAPVSHILGGLLVLPATHDVVRGFLDYVVDAPEELTTLADLMTAPELPFMPPEWVGTPVLMVLVAWCGTEADGERALAPLRALASPVADLVGWIPYPAIYQFTAHLAEPHAASIRMMFADELSDAAIEAMIAGVQDGPSPFNLIHLRGLGGALAHVPADETAFAHRERRYFVAAIAVWLDADDDPAPHEAWTLALWRALRPEGTGVYVNFLENEGPERVREAYPGTTYDRLAEIKRRYDPDNVFRFNQNVPPAS